MNVVTAADEKFKPLIAFWESRIHACGLNPLIYDLGGLGAGTPLDLSLPGFSNFREHGYYLTLGDGTYKSRAVHKPSVVIYALRETHQPVLYLDTDAILRGVPTKMAGEWDVCVTVRPTDEQDRSSDDKRSYIGLLNAGVIWFNYTPAALNFVGEWHARTMEEMNDQRALNLMCQDVQVGKIVTVLLLDGTPVRVLAVPTVVYNNYYTGGVQKAAVVHLKNGEWVGKTTEELHQRCKVLENQPMPVKEKIGFFSRIFGSKPKPVHHHGGCCHHETVYVYDDSGTDLMDYYYTYRVLDSLFNNPPPAAVLDNFVPPPQPDYQESTAVQPQTYMAEGTTFPDELRNVVTPDTRSDDTTPATPGGS